MKKIILLVTLFLFLGRMAEAQVVCIMCYDQNNAITPSAINRLTNGSFEQSSCMIGSGQYGFYCPNSLSYNCDITNWTCTGGGTSTYANILDTNTYIQIVPDGARVVYFGNFFCTACSFTGDTSCLADLGCTVTGLHDGFPNNTLDYGGTNGVSIQQTVNGLVVGNTYVLEFWAGGEGDQFSFPNRGVFAVDVGFGDTLLRNNCTFNQTAIGTRYLIEFNAVSTSHTIKFTNWGHISSTATELVLDDVKLYTLAELPASIPTCSTAPTPNANFYSSDTSWCNRKTINFYDLSTNSPTSWHWDFPGAIPDSSNLQNPTGISYLVTGSFAVTLIACNSYGCDTLTYDPYIFEFNPPPPPTVTQNGSALCVQQYPSYQWYRAPDSTNILSSNQCFFPPGDGNYFIIVTDTNGCNISSSLVTITNVFDFDKSYSIKVFQHPSTMELMIETTSNEKMEFILYDITGKKILSQQFTSSAILNTESIAKGMYVYEIRTGSRMLQKGNIVNQ